jgi:hypothetical protein
MFIDQIKDFDQGESIVSSEFREKLNNLVEACRSNTITSVVGGQVKHGKNGTSIVINKQIIDTSETVKEDVFPFKIFTRTNPSNPLLFQARVYDKSDVLKSINLTDKLNVTGLTTYNTDGSVKESSWFSYISNDVIYLTYTIGDASATIHSYGQGDSGFNPASTAGDASSVIAISGGTQTTWRIMLGYSLSDDDGNPVLTQTWNTHVLISNGCITGKGCVYDFTSPRGAYVV